jgi:hypothetical protein
LKHSHIQSGFRLLFNLVSVDPPGHLLQRLPLEFMRASKVSQNVVLPGLSMRSASAERTTEGTNGSLMSFVVAFQIGFQSEPL